MTWVLNQTSLGGTKYKHCISFDTGLGYLYFEAIDGSSSPYTHLNYFKEAHPNGTYAINGLLSYRYNSKKHICVAQYLTTGNNKVTVTFSGVPYDTLTASPTQFTMDLSALVTDTVYEIT